MICQNCGTFNNDDAAFCTACGADLRTQAPVAQPQQESYPNTYYQPQESYPNTYYQPQEANPYGAPPVKAPTPGKGLAIAGMILGIISILCFPAITGTLGIIFGAVAKSKGCKSGMATAGIVCGAIGVGLWLVMLIACSGAGMATELLDMMSF